jgi:hypothetical protein
VLLGRYVHTRFGYVGRLEAEADMSLVLHYLGFLDYTTVYPLTRLHCCVQWESTQG